MFSFLGHAVFEFVTPQSRGFISRVADCLERFGVETLSTDGLIGVLSCRGIAPVSHLLPVLTYSRCVLRKKSCRLLFDSAQDRIGKTFVNSVLRVWMTRTSRQNAAANIRINLYSLSRVLMPDGHAVMEPRGDQIFLRLGL